MMKRLKVNTLSLWNFDHFSSEKEIRHFITDRFSGESADPFTLSLSSHPSRDFVLENRHRLAVTLGLEPDDLFFPSQVHGTRIVVVKRGMSKDALMETDALVTAERGLCIAVLSADCVPILLFDRRNQVVAAIHSGWRGTVQKILAKTVTMLVSDFGAKPGDIIAGIGPSVCQDSYEVGEEVIQHVESTFSNHHKLLAATGKGKAKLDLWQANKVQLREAGVPEKNIEIAELCTIKNNQHFFSARKGDSGRFAAGIMLI